MADLHTSVVKKEIRPGVAVRLSPLVQRITAPNAGPMTGPGTNTYLLGAEEITVIDPGPKIDSHIEAIVKTGGNKITRVLVTHTHPDHSPAAKPLADACGAELIGCVLADDGHQDRTFEPTIPLVPDQLIQAKDHCIDAVFTPGHVGNHYCFYVREDKLLFTGDHIMQGATVVIIPPSGDMADYIQSLQKLLAYDITYLAPAHGHLMSEAHRVIQEIIDHRLAREMKVVEGLRRSPNTSLDKLMEFVYADVDPRLQRIAKLSLWAHLLKLEKQNRAAKHSEDHWLFGDELWALTDGP